MADPSVAAQKASLVNWWKNFTSKSPPQPAKRGFEVTHRGGKGSGSVFGVSLRESLRLASVAICMKGDDGHSYVYGYIPVIVAKCGVYLKENGTDVEGVFRVSGSNKRMKELQQTFDLPPRYGKDLTWAPGNGSVHDAASVLRRYLTMLPEPLIPCDLWSSFRNVHTRQPFVLESAIASYRLLITSLPDSSQHLLLYVLDLLAVFARKSHKTLMTASNLAMVFQPGLVVGPLEQGLKTGKGLPGQHGPTGGAALLEGAKEQEHEHRMSQEILEFLIQHQDHFVASLDMTKERVPAPGSRKQEGSGETTGSEGVVGGPEHSKSDGELEEGVGGLATATGRRRSKTDGAELARRASEKVDSPNRRMGRKSKEGTTPVGSPETTPSKAGKSGSLKRSRTVPGLGDAGVESEPIA